MLLDTCTWSDNCRFSTAQNVKKGLNWSFGAARVVIFVGPNIKWHIVHSPSGKMRWGPWYKVKHQISTAAVISWTHMKRCNISEQKWLKINPDLKSKTISFILIMLMLILFSFKIQDLPNPIYFLALSLTMDLKADFLTSSGFVWTKTGPRVFSPKGLKVSFLPF